MTVQRLEELTGKLCDKYCIYAKIFSSEEEQDKLDDICRECPMNGLFELLDDINKNERQAQAPALRIGGSVWIFTGCDDELNGYSIEEYKVNEVGINGFFVSDFSPPGDDFGSYFPYEQIGNTVFFDKQGAENKVRENIGGVANDNYTTQKEQCCQP